MPWERSDVPATLLPMGQQDFSVASAKCGIWEEKGWDGVPVKEP
jgi:hypothetical protein